MLRRRRKMIAFQETRILSLSTKYGDRLICDNENCTDIAGLRFTSLY